MNRPSIGIVAQRKRHVLDNPVPYACLFCLVFVVWCIAVNVDTVNLQVSVQNRVISLVGINLQEVAADRAAKQLREEIIHTRHISEKRHRVTPRKFFTETTPVPTYREYTENLDSDYPRLVPSTQLDPSTDYIRAETEIVDEQGDGTRSFPDGVELNSTTGAVIYTVTTEYSSTGGHGNVAQTTLSTNHGTRDNVCTAPRKFVFLKNHKAGSSSVNMLLRMAAEKYNFHENLHRFGPWNGGYPGPFNASFHEKDKPTDIIIAHLRWNWTEMQKLLTEPKNQKRIAIVREPLSLLKSSYNYFYAQFIARKNQRKLKTEWKAAAEETIGSCMGQPFWVVLGQKLNRSLGDYIDMVIERPQVLARAPWNFRGNNSQSYDFGHMPASDISKTFDLVMVLDRFHESLVLLRDTLCLDWEDVIPFAVQTVNSKSYKDEAKYALNDAQIKYANENLVHLDRALYNEANRILDAKVRAYGVGKMRREIRQYFVEFDGEIPPIKSYRLYPGGFDKEIRAIVKPYMKKYHGSCAKPNPNV